METARRLRRVYREIEQQPRADRSAAESELLDNKRLLLLQLEDLASELSPKLCTDLTKTSKRGDTSIPRLYRAVYPVVEAILDRLASRESAKTLDTSLLTRMLAEQFAGFSLTMDELNGVPVIAKLAAMEKIAENACSPQSDTAEAGNIVSSGIKCLRFLGRVRWQPVMEEISATHQILCKDPAGAYPAMDFDSREQYRKAIRKLASEAKCEEEYVAKIAVSCAMEAAEKGLETRLQHVGYYLIGAGTSQLRMAGELRSSLSSKLQAFALRFPNLVYIGLVFLLTLAFASVIFQVAQPLSGWWWALFLLPASGPAVALANLLLNRCLPRRIMPRLDFSRGIPNQHRTFVVIPTLLLSEKAVDRLLERIEIHYLANRDPNLKFALLTDFPDFASPMSANTALLERCARGIRRLNREYSEAGAPFYLFHRPLRWNESQRMWMGHERKRGKLEDFNRLLLGIDDCFELKVGDLSVLPTIQYVITLDTDTQLPRETAWKLVGTMAHPLHRPVYEGQSVKAGYTILQPRVSTTMESANRSVFSRIMSGRPGVDPYTAIIADVYHDLHGQASFSGKGIYDLRAFHAVLDGRFPENTLLSHDLIEGEHGRVGLVSDVELVEDQPSTYESYCKRKHRWTRGDWQILFWLGPRVPSRNGAWVRNPLGVLSIWKLTDNLRRSLFEISLIAMVIAAWLLAPASAIPVTLSALAVVLFPACADFVLSLMAALFSRPGFGACLEQLLAFGRAIAEAALNIVLLPHQAVLMADATTRTLFRMFVSRRNLLEWESMAQVEEHGGGIFNFWAAASLAAIACAAGFAVWFQGVAPLLPLTLTALWIASPLIAAYLKYDFKPQRSTQSNDMEFLREIALRTWRYFVDFSRAETNWLVPDNMQEEPEFAAHRASPTNIGLQIASNVAAADFGFITRQELSTRLHDLLNTIGSFETYRGHLFNWYDTRTLEPLSTKYVSSVDSGNLAAALIAVKQACKEIPSQTIFESRILDGIRDHCGRLRVLVQHRSAADRYLRMLAQLTMPEPSDLFNCRRRLALAAALVEKIGRVWDTLPESSQKDCHERHYWFAALQERVAEATRNLEELAPWLKPAYDVILPALQGSGHPECQDLIAAFSANGKLEDLPPAYDNMEAAIRRLVSIPARGASTLPSGLRLAFTRLLRDIAMSRQTLRQLLDSYSRNARAAARIADGMDFAFLFDFDRELLRIGANIDTGSLDESYYDLLASEARTAVFFGIAKGDLPRRSWFQLGRKLIASDGHRTLMSWSGTMFEYLMPCIFMRLHRSSLLGKCIEGAIGAQQAYAQRRNIPWGISESSCSRHVRNSEYDYRAFGIPTISLRSSNPGGLVIAPYATMLAAMVQRDRAVENLKAMAAHGWMGRYGFYEAIEFREAGQAGSKAAVVVRSFMAHHQGMSLLSLCNAVLGNVMQERFHREPMVAATDLILQERAPLIRVESAQRKDSESSPDVAVAELNFDYVP